MISLRLIPLFLVLTAGSLWAKDPGSGTGVIAESINVGNYTYLRLTEPDIWLATSHLEANDGDRVTYVGGMEMRDFYSKSLDRKFTSIIFVQRAYKVGPDGKPVVAEERDETSAYAPKAATSVQTPLPSEIQSLPDGMTVAEILNSDESFNDQPVRLRAKVIKVSPNIMGKNWITLSDGTGAQPDNKLIATSQQQVSLGDVVIVHGVIRKDIDLGAGYLYKVLLEEAEFHNAEGLP
ncbi:MAG: hypothetical protein KZQ93_18005 [Candidatus Thiodiazotropha sp. (ex Monitilora ramsayi)]|nr:hypothetical protein [Candidatus Thiodiazotropha sp. (ex Monitilora ramsayi)]